MYISVIVAAHNEERYIARALEALRASLAKYEHEIIVVCDRCTDRTPEIGSKLGDKVVIKDESKWSNSYAENLAIGLAEATGEYIAIVDADMVVEEQYFAKVLDAFKDPGVVSVSGRVITEGSSARYSYLIW
jgi:glycosyltransferase involved in cell wall biosynthesis